MARASSALLKRRLDIAQIVRKQGEVKVDELSDMLRVSNVTIRQDLTYLEQQGYLKRSFGGAIYISPENLINHTNIEPPNCINIGIEGGEIDLVKNCLNYINDGDTVFLSHGNSIRKLIPFLHNKKSLRLIMNDIRNAQLVREFSDAEVILIGGILQDGNTLQNSNTLTPILNQFHISHFIFELAAINAHNQLMIENSEQQNTYQQIFKNADHTIGIMPQRFLLSDNYSIGKLKHLDVVILSKPAVTEYHQQLLDSDFKQRAINKYCITYHNSKVT
ncbi:DeoR/GlpR transcriptional regulator [Gilliamella sp. B2776]|uniref:DeoR/GlpR family DNA-binding transcription regulator n=1 Tax=unclassified Gilliamella TaxID=2685620 RepID=UPI00226A03B3|nr:MULTISPECIES: DeoR/GlpR family DNA-binding transcription regulator [unclassified Gilliamella]MCX8648882.1 DeoR/GlpR transcriptional regulator [Gilliamella sp. B2779]MCX8653242.1 DeoR/GlpR transcriptional regulator [Gilliamella sp. B2737]MCX8655502.1 DeoR/GlpR transcriptional regulator [Gilliamella sp. B2894]MCX8664267.1 DeoR/GlpR transcriptional regulator [Gilliamella sp. B2887]MCX8690694.1 DeoR/GlpR transcriptional regulator [Gilliamella sp. B2776]